MSRRIIIAGAHPVAYLDKARELGFDAEAIESPGAVARCAEKHRPDGILAVSDDAVVPVAEATAALGIPGNTPEAARCLSDAEAARRVMEAAGLPTPQYREAGSRAEAQAEAAARELGAPIVVRPADGGVGGWTQRVDHVEEVTLAYAQATKHSHQRKVLLEEFIDGPTRYVWAFMAAGKPHFTAVVGVERRQPPYEVAMGLSIPGPVNPAVKGALLDAARTAIEAADVSHGLVQLEFVLADSGPRMIGMAQAAGSAALLAELVTLAYGDDLMADLLRVTVGEAPQGAYDTPRGAALRWIPSRSGLVAELRGFDEARALPGVERVTVTARVGDRLGHVVDNATREAVGSVLASGGSVEEAIATATQAQALCRAVTKPSYDME
jgi:S-sulfo-L-cysteine synthase (3-phospho-L-serine-dependent)